LHRQLSAFVETKPKHSLNELNSLACAGFVRIVGPVFEHSSWIAETAWAKRPFISLENLHAALMDVVRESGETKQVSLIQAHPDLVGRAAPAGTLTPESSREQASAGLGRLSAAEIAAFQTNNRVYRDKFGFPFVICARLNKKEAILKGFETRLQNPYAQEIKTALEEIGKIAWLRLLDLTGLQ
jgi:2-oxo-4-hydroxy-4-carboxy-5-ureidoimidazoline decarboxylase